MRRIDDQLAAVGNDRFEFIHAFAARPKFRHTWRARRRGRYGRASVFVRDVDLARKFAGLVPGGLGRAGEKAGEDLSGATTMQNKVCRL